MEHVWQDVKFGLRMLAKSPAFTMVAVLSLALGIGANTAVFSLLDAALLRRLPVPEPERLVNFQIPVKGGGFDPSFNYPLYTDYRDRNTVLEGLACYDSLAMTLVSEGQAERARGMIVSGNFFDVLGVRPALGRWFLPEEDRTPETHPVVVLGHSFWQQRFAGDAGVTGHTLRLNGREFQIIGVAPRQFTGTMRGFVPDFYIPMMMFGTANPSQGNGPLRNRGYTWMEMIGRLKPGVTRYQAQQAMQALATRIREVTPMNTNPELVLSDGSRGFTGLVTDLETPLQMVQLVVGLVLLIACANVANLLLARALTRRREVAIRLALGAGRGRLVRQLLTESILLALAGGSAGLVLAPWVVDLLLYFRPWPTFAVDVHLYGTAMGVSLLLMVGAGLLFGIAPALQAARTNLIPALKEQRNGSGNRAWLRSGLVVAQLALSLAVLVTAGLFLRSLQGLRAIDAGFDPDRVVAMSIDAGRSGYDEPRARALYDQLVEGVTTIPGVESVALGAVVPLAGSGMRVTSQPEGHVSTNENPINLNFNIVSPNWFRVMGASLVRGRDFAAADSANSAPVVIVNEALAAQYWPGQEPLGRFIEMSGVGPNAEDTRLGVIGVVRDTKYRSLTEPVPPMMFLPLAQNHRSSMVLFVRGGQPGALATPIRKQVQQLDANLPVYNIRTLAEQKDSSLYTSRLSTTLLSLLGALGLSLAALGVYGMMAYAVEQRTREIGIRMALGAQPGDVRAWVIGLGARFLWIGLVLGAGGALAMARLVRAQLYGVQPADPLTFSSVAALLAGVALVACGIPAWRASRIDPIRVLRYE